MLYAYSDASLKYPALSLGYVIVDENKEKIDSGGKLLSIQSETVSTLDAELKAMVSAARACCEYDQKVVFLTDDDTLPLHIAEEDFPSDTDDLHSFKSFAGRLKDWSVVWRPRQENRAHEVAANLMP